MNETQAERIGELYAECLKRYDDFGTFQMALSNAMSYRHYNWDIDQFESVLERMNAVEASGNPARRSDMKLWDELTREYRGEEE